MASKFGLSYEVALYAAGIGAPKDVEEWSKCLFGFSDPVRYCDSKDDQPYIKMGVDYNKEGNVDVFFQNALELMVADSNFNQN